VWPADEQFYTLVGGNKVFFLGAKAAVVVRLHHPTSLDTFADTLGSGC
jgi:hypothetical protein